MAVPGDPGGTLIFTRMVSQGNSCEFGHYNFGYSLVRSPRIRSRAVHPSFNSQEDEGKFAQSHGTVHQTPDGQQISSAGFSGKTDQTVNLSYRLPEGYHLYGNQSLVSTYKIGRAHV